MPATTQTNQLENTEQRDEIQATTDDEATKPARKNQDLELFSLRRFPSSQRLVESRRFELERLKSARYNRPRRTFIIDKTTKLRQTKE